MLILSLSLALLRDVFLKLLVLENNSDGGWLLVWISDLEEGMVVFELGLAGFAIVEVLADRALISGTSDSGHLASIADDIGVERIIGFLFSDLEGLVSGLFLDLEILLTLLA